MVGVGSDEIADLLIFRGDVMLKLRGCSWFRKDLLPQPTSFWGLDWKLFPFSQGFLANCHPIALLISFESMMFRLSQGWGKGLQSQFFINQLEVLSFWGNRREPAVCKSWMYILSFIKQLYTAPNTKNLPHFQYSGNTSTQMVENLQPAMNKTPLGPPQIWALDEQSWNPSLYPPGGAENRKGGDFLSIKTPLSNFVKLNVWGVMTSNQHPTTNKSTINSSPLKMGRNP